MPIFDQGYQHWSGKLSGHAVRWLAVTRHGVRATIRSRWVKLLLIGAWMPAIVLVSFLALWGLLEQRAESVLTFLARMLPAEIVKQPQEFRSAIWTIAYSFFYKFELFAAIMLVLVVGPSLVSRDLRFNAFPLYFSRPIRRFDYFVGKLGVIGFFLLAIAVLPGVVAYLFGLAFSLDLGVIRDTHRLLWGGVLYGLIITVSAGTLMLALSSLSRRSIYVGLAWAGFCFITMTLSEMLVGLRVDGERRAVQEKAMAEWLPDHPPPPGIEVNGFSIRRQWKNNDEMKAQQEWLNERGLYLARSFSDVGAKANSDWRRLLAYHTNLSRISDWLLDTDRAWVTIGTAVENSRRAVEPMAKFGPGGRALRDVLRPPNNRFLADQFVLQYPVIWSVGVLVGLWFLSAFILSTRVKSLDRLK